MNKIDEYKYIKKLCPVKPKSRPSSVESCCDGSCGAVRRQAVFVETTGCSCFVAVFLLVFFLSESFSYHNLTGSFDFHDFGRFNLWLGWCWASAMAWFSHQLAFAWQEFGTADCSNMTSVSIKAQFQQTLHLGWNEPSNNTNLLMKSHKSKMLLQPQWFSVDGVKELFQRAVPRKTSMISMGRT